MAKLSKEALGYKKEIEQAGLHLFDIYKDVTSNERFNKWMDSFYD